MAELRVEGLVKTFGEVRAVDDVTFTVADGEFLTLLGPIGCGKSTTLAAVARLDRPDGRLIALGDKVFFDGRTRRFLQPEGSAIGLVFHSSALCAHMNVREKLDFLLRPTQSSNGARAHSRQEGPGPVWMHDHRSAKR